jgi:hypothetical protein
VEKLKTIPYVKTGNDTWVSPDRLLDPRVELFSAMFTDDGESVFPQGEFASAQWLEVCQHY